MREGMNMKHALASTFLIAAAALFVYITGCWIPLLPSWRSRPS
jgi:hypothetical protein